MKRHQILIAVVTAAACAAPAWAEADKLLGDVSGWVAQSLVQVRCEFEEDSAT